MKSKTSHALLFPRKDNRKYLYFKEDTMLPTAWWKSFLWCPVVCRVHICVFFHFPRLSCWLWSNNRGVEKWCISNSGAALSRGTLESSGYACKLQSLKSLSRFTFSLTSQPPAAPGILWEKKRKRQCLTPERRAARWSINTLILNAICCWGVSIWIGDEHEEV